MRWVIWLFAGLLVIAIGIVGFFWYQTYTAQGLGFSINVPAHVQVGVPFDIEIEITNDAGAILQDAILSLSLPEDMVFLGKFTGKSLVQEDLGNIGQGSIVKDKFQAMIVSGESTIKKIEGIVSYLPSSLGARFERFEERELRVSDSGILLDIESPSKVFSGEEFEIEISYENGADVIFADLVISFEFPDGFTLISSTLEPSVGDSVFEIGNLASGASNSFTLKGKLDGPDNAFFDILAVASAEFFGDRYDLNKKIAGVSISPSPLALNLSVNNKADYIASAGDELDYTISYRNNTRVGLSDVVVKAKLIGAMFDWPSIDTGGGAFNSATKVITWNASQIPGLKTLAPGEGRQINFTIDTLQNFPISRMSDTNFELKVEAEIESPTVPEGVASSRTIGSNSITSKVAGQLFFRSSVLFKDAESGILNEGVHPPIVGQTTQYTIHWILQNVSNDMENIEVSAFLGPNVEFTGESKSSTGISPSYNSRTSEMVWEIDRIVATAGILSSPIEAVFQIALTPGIDQTKTAAVLVKPATIRARDVFIDKLLEFSAEKLDTFSVPSDGSGGGQVRS